MNRCPTCQRLIVVDLPEAVRFARLHNQRPEDSARVADVRAEIGRHYRECFTCQLWKSIILEKTSPPPDAIQPDSSPSSRARTQESLV